MVKRGALFKTFKIGGTIRISKPSFDDWLGDESVYLVKEIGEILGVSGSTVYNLINMGQFKSVRIGSMIRIPKKGFDQWLGDQLYV